MTSFLPGLLANPAPREFAIRIGGQVVAQPASSQEAKFTVVIDDLQQFGAIAANPNLFTLGQAYVDGLWDIEGDLEAALRWIQGVLPPTPVSAVTPATEANPASREQTNLDVNSHYDLPVEFWRLWLDENLLYTCAYYERPDEELEVAQLRKLELVCRKLRLAKDELLLDIGCGWGPMLVYAARVYGARVHGLTLSELQAAEARRLLDKAQVGPRGTVQVLDARDVDPSEKVDKISAIGVIEHIGEHNQVAFLTRAYEALRPGGLMLVQGINYLARGDLWSGDKFVKRFVFPGAVLSSVGGIVRNAETAGFEIRDVESLRDHYLITIREWRRRLEKNARAIQDLVGQPRYRIFRAYLAAFALEFETGRYNVHQVLLAKAERGRPPTPLGRADLYR